MFKPQQAGHAVGDERFVAARKFAEQRRQRGAGLETGNAQQDVFIIGGNGHFREHRIFLQFSELGIAQAAAFNPGKTTVAAENPQVAPHLALGIAVRGKQMPIVG